MIEAPIGPRWLPQGSVIADIPCTVDIENTADSLHAHVELEGVEVGPGDTLLVHGAPTDIEFGHKGLHQCRATLIRASLFERTLIRVAAYLGLTELYEVSFSPGRV
ncbi:hypothetical protein [Rhodospirillum centenum]|uniref:Uncharacterized protein n=1 Tax=Rhodospirillum centenum (strain ATCC 51521 / SW) TaxID=414684 RepID=B6ITV9_RHOCS|nr:hypothetical protein [Rhodospirillum centenum]ACI99495.1 conserved hypothetical protein [Rhodospirillum centenum SW]